MIFQINFTTFEDQQFKKLIFFIFSSFKTNDVPVE